MLPRIEDLAKHLKQYLGRTMCRIHYVRPLSDGSDEINDNVFFWTGNQLVKY